MNITHAATNIQHTTISAYIEYNTIRLNKQKIPSAIKVDTNILLKQLSMKLYSIDKLIK